MGFESKVYDGIHQPEAPLVQAAVFAARVIGGSLKLVDKLCKTGQPSHTNILNIPPDKPYEGTARGMPSTALSAASLALDVAKVTAEGAFEVAVGVTGRVVERVGSVLGSLSSKQ